MHRLTEMVKNDSKVKADMGVGADRYAGVPLILEKSF